MDCDFRNQAAGLVTTDDETGIVVDFRGADVRDCDLVTGDTRGL